MAAKSTFVDERFPQKFNCAQTVFSLHADELGLSEETALKLASGFGGGMACAETCGAVTGSYMVIGMRHGHISADPAAKAATKERILKFNEAFEKEHGSLVCRKLTGYDISTPDGSAAAAKANVFSEVCPNFVKTACDILSRD